MSSDTMVLGLGAALNLLVAALIVRFIYYPRTRKRGFVFSFLALNTIIYFVLALLSSIELSIGVGFGLFAIFSVLRYRTDPIPIREMTYLFVLIALPVVNVMAIATGSMWTLILADGMVAAVLYVLEQEWGFEFRSFSRITYDRLDLLARDATDELVKDIQKRTGLVVDYVKVERVDLIRDSAELRVYHSGKTNESVADCPLSEIAR